MSRYSFFITAVIAIIRMVHWIHITFEHLLTNILEPVSYLIFALAFLLHLKKDNSVKVWALIAFYVFATLLMTVASVHVFLATPNIAEYNWLIIFTLISSGFYFTNLLYSSAKKKIVYGLCLLFLVYFVVHQFQQKANEIFDSIGYSLLSLMVITMAFMYFHQLLTNVTEKSIFVNADFWFVSGIFIYYLGCFIIFLTFYYLTQKVLNTHYTMENRWLVTDLWGAHNILLFLSAFIFSFNVVWTTSRRRSLS